MVGSHPGGSSRFLAVRWSREASPEDPCAVSRSALCLSLPRSRHHSLHVLDERDPQPGLLRGGGSWEAGGWSSCAPSARNVSGPGAGGTKAAWLGLADSTSPHRVSSLWGLPLPGEKSGGLLTTYDPLPPAPTKFHLSEHPPPRSPAPPPSQRGLANRQREEHWAGQGKGASPGLTQPHLAFQLSHILFLQPLSRPRLCHLSRPFPGPLFLGLPSPHQ